MYRRILVAVDGTKACETVLEQAVGLARELDAELHAISVQERVRPLEAIGMEVEVPQAVHDEHFEVVGDRIRRAAEAAEVRLGASMVIKGDPASVILRQVKETGFDFVVLGRRGGGIMHRLRWRSTAHKVMACSPCPVVISPYSCEPFDTIKS